MDTKELRLAYHGTQAGNEEKGSTQIVIRLTLSQLLNRENFSNRDLFSNIAPMKVIKHLYVSMN